MAVDPLLESITPKTDWYVIIRRLQGDSRFFERGEVVDTSGWRRVDALVANRYIAPLPHGAKVPEKNSSGVRLLQQAESAPKAKKAVKKTTKKAPSTRETTKDMTDG